MACSFFEVIPFRELADPIFETSAIVSGRILDFERKSREFTDDLSGEICFPSQASLHLLPGAIEWSRF